MHGVLSISGLAWSCLSTSAPGTAQPGEQPHLNVKKLVWGCLSVGKYYFLESGTSRPPSLFGPNVHYGPAAEDTSHQKQHKHLNHHRHDANCQGDPLVGRFKHLWVDGGGGKWLEGGGREVQHHPHYLPHQLDHRKHHQEII